MYLYRHRRPMTMTLCHPFTVTNHESALWSAYLTVTNHESALWSISITVTNHESKKLI